MAPLHFHGLHPSQTGRANKSAKLDSWAMKDHRPVIPDRRSSVNIATNERHSDASIRASRHGFYTRGSKAQQILGTGGIQSRQQEFNKLAEQKHRRNSTTTLRTNGNNSSTKEIRSTGFSAIREEPELPPQLPPPQLRVRASSPLLGKLDQTYGTRRSNEPPNTAHHSGSSPVRNSREIPKPLSPREYAFRNQLDNVQQRNDCRSAGSSTADSKRKARPRKLDLSLLFPRPRPVDTPLLSPQRMMNSPSSISLESDRPTARYATGRRRTKTSSGSNCVGQERIDEEDIPSESMHSNLGDPNSIDTSAEKVVTSSDIDRALYRYFWQQRHSVSSDRTPPAPARSGTSYEDREKSHKASDSRPTEYSTGRRPSNQTSVSNESRKTVLTPKNQASRADRTLETGESRHSGAHSRFGAGKDSMSKRSSKNNLKNVDLHTSSFLCLSSSEDEGDVEDEEPPKHRLDARDYARRNSLAMDENPRPDVYKEAARAPTGDRLAVPDLTGQCDGWQCDQIIQSFPRPLSESSKNTSSTATRRNRHRQSSDIPTISETDTTPTQNQYRPRPVSSTTSMSKDANRRSRIVSVTREELNFLEAMRHRRGKVTPSLFRETRESFADSEKASMLSASVPSRDSFYGGDMSFLRLSPGTPSCSNRASYASSYMDNKDRLFPQSNPGTEQKADDSDESRRVSLAYSESLPSSYTDRSSPMTPVLPIRRFSPLPSQKSPPQQPLPAAPPLGRRDSRPPRDSNEALILDDTEEAEKDEFPIWAYGWCNEVGSLSTVPSVH